MKKKRSPKLKIEEIRNEVRGFLEAWQLYPDKITVGEDNGAEVYFAPENPQTRHVVKSLLAFQQDGYITIQEPFLWNGPGFDVTAVIRVNREALYPLSCWQRLKSQVFSGLK